MSEIICPILKGPCIKHDCAWYGHLLGRDPQTGVPQDRWDCVVSFIPMLLIEGAGETRQAAAAIESLRNRVAEGNDTNQRLADSMDKYVHHKKKALKAIDTARRERQIPPESGHTIQSSPESSGASDAEHL